MTASESIQRSISSGAAAPTVTIGVKSSVQQPELAILHSMQRQSAIATLEDHEFQKVSTQAEPVKQGWLSWAITGVAQVCLGSYAERIDKAGLVAAAKGSMMNDLKDPQFIEFFDFVHTVVAQKVEGKLKEMAGTVVGDTALSQKKLIYDLLEINLARGFANLAHQIKEQSHNIPHYAQQPSLVNMLSLLCQKVGVHLDMQRLETIESAYQKHCVEFERLLRELIPSIDQNPAQRALIDQAVRDLDWLALEEFLPVASMGTELANQFFVHASFIGERKDLLDLFSEVSDDVLLYLFPNKVQDLEVPGLLQMGFIPKLLYKFIHSIFTSFLKNAYMPLENNVKRLGGWEGQLKKRIGEHDLQPLIQAPTAFLMGYTKNYIQSDPQAASLVSGMMGGMQEPLSEENQKDHLQQHAAAMAQLAQEKLAGWVIESIQVILHTEDPHLLSLGRFTQQVFDQLTVALMAKGTSAVISENEKIKENQFFRVLMDRLVAKFKSIQEQEEVSEENVRDFFADLPLPSFLKEMLVPLISEKAKELQKKVKEIQEIQKLHENSGKTLASYKGGAQLLSITEKISDKIIEKVLDRDVSLVSTLGLGETIEELCDQYLPDVKINEDLKKWFKENVSTLNLNEGGESSQSVLLLKQGIQAVLRKALVTTIETNFKNKSEDYAAQLLANLHQAFEKTFKGFDDKHKREELTQALKIQEAIQRKMNQIQALKDQAVALPNELEATQETFVEEIMRADRRYRRAKDYVCHLKEKQEKSFHDLNRVFAGEVWNESRLLIVDEALNVYKLEAPRGVQAKPGYAAKVYREITRLSVVVAKEGPENTANKQRLERLQTLMILLDRPAEDLKLLTEALNIRTTLKQAEKELQLLEGKWTEKEKALETQKEGLRKWITDKLQNREKIHQLEEEIANLQVSLDGRLKDFRTLAHELTALMGLDRKDQLQLPAFLSDQVWSYIEEAKDKQIARLLFEYISPLLLPGVDTHQNREKLQKLTEKDFLAQLAYSTAQEAISSIPDFVTSYKPFAKQILELTGGEGASPQEIADMENQLQQMMIGLGKAGVTASMLHPLFKGLVPQGKETAVSQVLTQLVQQSRQVSEIVLKEDFSKDQLLAALKNQGITPQEAQAIAKALNQFLLNRGKPHLPAYALANYQQRVGAQALREETLKSLSLVFDKIAQVVITPEEIAQSLNDVIPGATDLHTLIAPQLQAVITGEDSTFQKNRGILQNYVEGMLLRFFVKIADAHTQEGQSILAVLTQKLKVLASQAQGVEGKTTEEVARGLIDKVLSDILTIKTQEDLEGIPLPLRRLAYEKLKEQAYQFLTPLVLPLIERNNQRDALERVSGSGFLGRLCEALSKDTFALLPVGLNSYHEVAKKLFVELAGSAPTDEQAERLTQEIVTLLQNASQKNLTNKAILQAYSKVTGVKLTALQQTEKLTKLKKMQAKDEIKNVLITPEEIVASISGLLPHTSPFFRQSIVDEIYGLTHRQPVSYQNVTGVAQSYVESLLLKVFVRIAAKNPPQEGKDSLLVMTEKLVAAVTHKYHEAKTRPFEEVAKELNHEIMGRILGIASEDDLSELPQALRKKVFDKIQNQISGLLINMRHSLKDLENTAASVQKAREELKVFGATEEAAKAYAVILAEDLAQLVVEGIPASLARVEEKAKTSRGVQTVSKGITNYLEELARGNLQVAQLLLQYSQTPELQQVLGKGLAVVGDPTQLRDDKQKVVELVSNMLVVPLNELLQKAVALEASQGQTLDQDLAINILAVVTDYLKNFNQAKSMAKAQGREDIQHEEFVQAAGTKLHAAVPQAPISYQKVVDEIGKFFEKFHPMELGKWEDIQTELSQVIGILAEDERKGVQLISLENIVAVLNRVNVELYGVELTEEQHFILNNATTVRDIRKLIREASEAHEQQRLKQAYDPATRVLVKLLFPHGKKDLTYISEELRPQVWRMYKQNLFPIILPMVTELLLDPNTLSQIVLTSLETVRDALNTDVIVGESDASQPPREIDGLDSAAGELMEQVLQIVQLPEVVRKQIMDREGHVLPYVKQAIGATLRGKFNGNFIKETLKTGLKAAIRRDEKGQPLIRFDERPQSVKEAEAVENRQKMEASLYRVVREAVDASASYGIRLQWAQAQKKFDKLVQKVFGRVGVHLKKALDAVFRFIFFQLAGTVLLWVLKPILRRGIYSFILLDQNLQIIMDLLRKKPVDQPGNVKHVVYNEDLLYKLVLAGKQAVEKALVESKDTL